MLSFGTRPLLAAASLFLLPVEAICQAPSHFSLQAGANLPKPPRFEVAAIRPNRSKDLVRSFWFTPDGVSIKGFPLDSILKDALLEYGEDRIIGEPRWVKSDLYDIQASGPSLFTALKEQLGLKLEMQKRPVEVFVIDHIERPSPN